MPEAPRLGKGPCLAAVADGRKSSRQPGQMTVLGPESQSCVEHRSSIPGVGLDWCQPSLGQEPQDDVSIGPLLSRPQSPDLCNEMVAHRGFCDPFQTSALWDNLIRPPPSPPALHPGSSCCWRLVQGGTPDKKFLCVLARGQLGHNA